ncbi:hypothetical protein, partial [Actinocorallia lasiicapitis]
SLEARAHLLRGERAQASAAVEVSLDLIQRQRWMAFLPWAQALRAELDLLAGEPGRAAETLEQAWALSCQLDDACWLGMTARGLALVQSARGDHGQAGSWLNRASALCSGTPDRYQWVHAYVLDSAIGTALAAGDQDTAEPMIGTLDTLAAHCDLREFTVRAKLHRHALGDPRALPAAR